ncbi:MAG: PhoU domain-containing protein [Fidelibacterota bacterium]
MWKEFIQAWRSDNLLNQAWERSYDMLAISRDMFVESTRVLRTTDGADVSLNIRKQDKKINRYEREVRRKVMTHCSIGGSGIIGGMVLTSIVIDIERIGDYTKNILELAIRHPKRLVVDDFESELTEVEKYITIQFENIIDILKTSDEAQARKMIKTYRKEIKETCDAIVNQFIGGEVSGIPVDTATAMALYARYLKRISSHLTNILTSVINPFERIGFKEKKQNQL